MRHEEIELDMLREVSNIGVAHAATALAQLTGQTVRLAVPEVSLIGIEEVPLALGGPENVVAGLMFRVYGELRGSLLLVLPRTSVGSLHRLLLSDCAHAGLALTEDGVSMLREVGNIMASSYLNALSRLTRMTLIPSVPHFAYDMAGAVVDHILSELGSSSDTALLVETEFHSDRQGSAVRGRFFLIPDTASLSALEAILEGNGHEPAG